jgi:hypothetical protein
MTARKVSGEPDGNGIREGQILASDSAGITVSGIVDVLRLPVIDETVSGTYPLSSSLAVRVVDNYGHTVAEVGSPDEDFDITGYNTDISVDENGEWTTSGPTATFDP